MVDGIAENEVAEREVAERDCFFLRNCLFFYLFILIYLSKCKLHLVACKVNEPLLC